VSNAPSEPQQPAVISRRAWQVLAITSFATFVGALDASIMFVAFPSIQETFSDVSTAQLSWVINSYNIVFAALLVPGGRFADKIGRKRAFFLGIGIFTVSSAVAGASISPAMLIGARVVQACGAALLFPSSLALVLQEFPQTRRATAVGIWGAIGGLAAAIGPSLGALIIEVESWRLAFFINLPVGAAVIAVGTRVIAESREEDARIPDLISVPLLIAGVASLALGIVQTDEWGWTDPRTLGAFAAAAILIPAFILRSALAAAPVLDLTLFRNHNYRVANIATLAFTTGFAAMFFGMVLFLTNVWNYSILQAGLLLSPGPVLAAFVGAGAGRLADRIGHRPIMVPGGIIYAIGGAWLLTQVTFEREVLSVWLPSILLTGAGVGLVFPALSSAAAHGLPPPRFAVGSAVNVTVRQIGFVMGVALVIAFLGTPAPDTILDKFDRIFALLVAGGLTTAAIALAIDTRPRIERVSPAITTEPAVAEKPLPQSTEGA
jgi:EmrB/QacA subfamily drug resistance transporter